jgi:Zn-dependent protease with chaperone function
MEPVHVPVSDSFRKNATRSILALSLFACMYLALIAAGVLLTLLCAYGGFALMASWPSIITIMLGAGLISMGVLILIFLLKFVFKSHTVDRSHLTEITRQQEPRLFKFIESVVEEVGTRFPKKVYLSADVNASVFYDSSFWSMFLPVRKNLQIGVALINSVTEQEFRAILAHEFGHFSQQSMKLGSYVYHVNQAIYNMLYDNQGYDAIVQKWANLSGYFAVFVELAVWIIRGIQALLQRAYQGINLSYLGLSREMEFHADAVAAHVAGSQPLVTSLLRLNLAEASFNQVLNYYNQRLDEGIITDNVYKQHHWVMNMFASEDNLPMISGLPLVSAEYLSRFNKSLLNIKDQWASHPQTEERVAALEQWNIPVRYAEDNPANRLLINPENVERELTKTIFSPVQLKVTPVMRSLDEFRHDFEAEFRKGTLHPLFNGYYDNHNPPVIDLDSLAPQDGQIDPATFFSREKVDIVYRSIWLESDIASLRVIAGGKSGVRTFDYAGVKYQAIAAAELIPKLEKEWDQVKDQIQNNDVNICRYFLASTDGEVAQFRLLYQKFMEVHRTVQERSEIFEKIQRDTAFLYEVLPVTEIGLKLRHLRIIEEKLKESIQWALQEPALAGLMTRKDKDALELYYSQTWIYFHHEQYDQSTLDVLFRAVNILHQTLLTWYFDSKRNLLDFQVSLMTR